ncbi:hypothetical protein [Streptomyces viridochromogenes]|nr:hypothetical protein [Streptomyces viridochromogenes]
MTVIAIGVTTAIPLTACGAGTDTDSTGARTSSAPKGVVTQAAAKKIVDRYEQVNNKANVTKNSKLLATVEAGQVNEQSSAEYEQMHTWTEAAQKRYQKPFFYTNRKYYIPAAGSASWFAMQGTSTNEGAKGLMVFDKVGGTYKAVAAVWMAKGAAVPEIAVDRNGNAEAADPTRHVGALAPNQLGVALADLLETGGKKSGAKLASTTTTKDYVDSYRERNRSTPKEDLSWRTMNYFEADPAHPKVYALKTADGGQFALFPAAFKAEFLHRQFASGGVIIPGDVSRIYNPKKRAVMIDMYQVQAAAALSPGSKWRVLGAEDEMVDSK